MYLDYHSVFSAKCSEAIRKFLDKLPQKHEVGVKYNYVFYACTCDFALPPEATILKTCANLTGMFFF